MNELLRKYFPLLKRLNFGVCPQSGPVPSSFGGLAHTHADGRDPQYGMMCLPDEDWIWAYNQPNYPSEIMWHEYAHLVQSKVISDPSHPLHGSDGHGLLWQLALDSLGHPWLTAKIHTCTRNPSAEFIQDFLLNAKREYLDNRHN